jgi:GntP family gluconate:H+ symporter
MQADFGSLIVMLVALIVLVLGIIKLKVHPVFALIIVAVGSAIAFGIPLKDVISTVTGGFGGTIGNIGIVIILGCTMGVILEQTSGALVLATTILKIVGKKRSNLAMAISGYLVSIPVFSDSAIVILSPVARALSARGGVPLFALMGAHQRRYLGNTHHGSSYPRTSCCCRHFGCGHRPGYRFWTYFRFRLYYCCNYVL